MKTKVFKNLKHILFLTLVVFCSFLGTAQTNSSNVTINPIIGGGRTPSPGYFFKIDLRSGFASAINNDEGRALSTFDFIRQSDLLNHPDVHRKSVAVGGKSTPGPVFMRLIYCQKGSKQYLPIFELFHGLATFHQRDQIFGLSEGLGLTST